MHKGNPDLRIILHLAALDNLWVVTAIRLFRVFGTLHGETIEGQSDISQR